MSILGRAGWAFLAGAGPDQPYVKKAGRAGWFDRAESAILSVRSGFPEFAHGARPITPMREKVRRVPDAAQLVGARTDRTAGRGLPFDVAVDLDDDPQGRDVGRVRGDEAARERA